ncbi:hypothetical protein [Tortoise microvirus 81]|nr:hypothetical protein [Tortoise microvirus 81]
MAYYDLKSISDWGVVASGEFHDLPFNNGRTTFNRTIITSHEVFVQVQGLNVDPESGEVFAPLDFFMTVPPGMHDLTFNLDQPAKWGWYLQPGAPADGANYVRFRNNIRDQVIVPPAEDSLTTIEPAAPRNLEADRQAMLQRYNLAMLQRTLNEELDALRAQRAAAAEAPPVVEDTPEGQS